MLQALLRAGAVRSCSTLGSRRARRIRVIGRVEQRQLKAGFGDAGVEEVGAQEVREHAAGAAGTIPVGLDPVRHQGGVAVALRGVGGHARVEPLQEDPFAGAGVQDVHDTRSRQLQQRGQRLGQRILRPVIQPAGLGDEACHMFLTSDVT
jgi:hypothetical protein